MTNPNLSAILPFYSVEIALMFEADTRLPFFHRAQLAAFFRHLLGQNYQIDYHGKWAIESCEDGQTQYRSGDVYRCGITVYESGLPLLTHLLKQLQKLPDSVPRNIPKHAPFGKQMRFVGFYDRFRQRENTDLLTPYTEQTLLCELDLWRSAAHEKGLIIRTLSPLGIYRKDEHGTPKLCRNPQTLTANTFIKSCADSLQNLARAQGKTCTVILDELDIAFSRQHIFSIKDGYRKSNLNTKKNKKGYWKPLNGSVGLMQLPADKRLTDDHLAALILGGYCGIGMNTTFGLGRYQLETLDGQRPNVQTPLQPDESFLKQALDNAHIRSCYQHRARLAKQTQQHPTAKQIRVISEIIESDSASPLELTAIPKKDGTTRLLSIPSFIDRVAQSCISQLLQPALHQYLQHSSHGYRSGRSRFTAAGQIRQYYHQGYRYVFESDVEDFFPAVDWQDVEIRLRALFRQHGLIERLMAWVKAPIFTPVGNVERNQGLPQGSPVSPMLANLLLDDFIQDVESKGLKIVTYADDFVILARQPQQLAEAEREAVRSLAELNLQLKREKTACHDDDDSYVFLGLYFQQGNAIDLSQPESEALSNLPNQQPTKQPEKTTTRHSGKQSARLPSTLNTHLPLLLSRQYQAADEQQTIERLTAVTDQGRKSPHKTADKPLLVDEAMRLGIASQGTVLTISGSVKKISSLRGHLQVYDADRLVHHQPWTTLHSLALIGTQHITTPALKHAMKNEVAVHFIATSGDYLGATLSQRWQKNRLSVIKAQLAISKEKALAIAKTIVIARIRHIKEVLRQKSADKTQNCRLTLDRLQQQAQYARNDNQLLGIEGYVTRAYYRQMRALIDEKWQFVGRNRRPPRDPINAMLSLGYSLLYAHTQAMLTADGLHPDIGFYHRDKPGHAALASDLMEPFRHVIEQSCWKLVNTGILTPDDFAYGQYDCRFHDDALKRYFEEINDRFQRPLQDLGEGSEPTVVNLYGQLHKQNLSLMNALTKGSDFEAYKYR